MTIRDYPTPTLMVYAEMVSKQFEELYEFDVQVVMCHQSKGLTTRKRDEIRKEIGTRMEELEKTRVRVVKEINRRIKRDLGLSFGPADVQPFINKFVEENPLIGKGEAEIKTVLEQKKQEREKAKLKKA